MSLPENLLIISQEHIDQLVADKTREGHHLDFKRYLPVTWDNSAKHEFLADVTAFANSGGGDLIYGVEENGHAQALSVVPQTIANIDQEVLRLQDFLLNSSEPRVPGVKIHPVHVTVADGSGYVIVVRIPQSWAGPHRVKTNQHFFIRDGLRKRQLDVPELRSLFLRSENQAQRVNNFRTERLGKILSGDSPQRLVDGPILVVHFIPTQAALGLIQINPVPYTNQRGLPLYGISGGMARLNLDGALVVRNETPQGQTHGYSQFFRNGFFEATTVLVRRSEHEHVILPSLTYEQNLIELFGNFRAELERLDINSECAVMLSLLHADKVRLGVQSEWGFDEPHQTFFDRTILVLPDVLALSDSPAQQAMRPVFDLLWQSAGFISSRNYNAAGEWAPR